MEIGSSGAGTIGQVAATQTGTTEQVNRAERQATLETPQVQESQPPPAQNQRVGSVIDVSV